MTVLKNPWGLLNGDPDKPVRVEDVPSGLECNCFCPTPGCGARFVAVHCTPPRQSHFRHYKVEDCGASYESAVHLLAKQILHREKRIMLPYLDVQTSRSIAKVGTFSLKERLVERQLFRFDRVELEVWMDGRIPDVVLWKRDRDGNDHKLLVEIVVTHDISEDKLNWIRENDLATIKVYLGWADQAITEVQLKQILMKGRAPWGNNVVWWVHHPKLDTMQRAIDDFYLESLRDGTNRQGMSLKDRGQPNPSNASTDENTNLPPTGRQSGKLGTQGWLFD
jgi:hypothetical protein